MDEDTCPWPSRRGAFADLAALLLFDQLDAEERRRRLPVQLLEGSTCTSPSSRDCCSVLAAWTLLN